MNIDAKNIVRLGNLHKGEADGDHFMITATEATGTPEMVFMMGLPAAGKTTVAEMAYEATHTFIDCDRVKESHPDYDPLNPQTLHAWSKSIVADQLEDLFQNPTNAVYDSCGGTPSKMISLMDQARSAGMKVTLKFVIVDLQTSLARNARRERNVPVEILIKKAAQVQAAFDQIKIHADEVVEVENYYENPNMDNTL